MEDQKLFWSQNLRFLRNRKKMSQEELAGQLQVTRAKLNSHENGLSKNPPLEDLIRIADYFRIAVDTFLRIDLSKIGELKLRELETGSDVYLRGGNLRVLAITVDKANKENTEYVPIKAKAGYTAGYSDPEYIAALPKFTLPNLPASGTFRMFPTTGDSMLPIPENSDVITEFVQDWTTLHPDTPCIVILKAEQDFVFKMVTLQDNGIILLRSMNDKYQPYQVEASNVLEIWKYFMHQTNTLPETPTDLQEVKALLIDLKKSLVP